MLITFMGFFGWYQRSSVGDSSHTSVRVCFIGCIIVCAKFSPICHFTISQWVLVSGFFISIAIFLWILIVYSFPYSLSGSSATIYAYLSEFHDNKHRDRAIMIASVIFAIACNGMPLLAWAILSQNWEYHIDFLDITYKPWRAFIVICSLCSLLSFSILCFLPESPKFVLGQGKKGQAYEILQKMNRINNGQDALLGVFELYEESESIENRQRIQELQKSRFPFFATVWNQTAPLFRPPYLVPTFLICFIQVAIYFTANGFYMLYADILNRMVTNVNDPISERIMVCDVINKKTVEYNPTQFKSNNTVSHIRRRSWA